MRSIAGRAPPRPFPPRGRPHPPVPPAGAARVLGAILVVVPLFASGCTPRQEAGGERSEFVEVAAPPPAAALARAQAAADTLTRSLSGLLFATLEAEGPLEAVRVCSEVAQDMTAAHAGEGLTVRRVGTRVRNPLNRPDSLERAGLADFARALAARAQPAERARVLERADGTRLLEVLRPIVLLPRCVACHGPREEMDPAVASLIAQRYPTDEAVDYAPGDLRGAVSVRVELGAR